MVEEVLLVFSQEHRLL
jgi:hypothetical protein